MDNPGNRIISTRVRERERLTFPRASKPLSKKRMIARKVKKMPKPMRPNPISANKRQYCSDVKKFFILLMKIY